MTNSNNFSIPKNGFEFAFVDVETTGLDPINDRIIEICVIIVVVGEKNHTSQSNTIRLGRPLNSFIVELTGISDEELEKSGTAEEVLPEYFDLIGDRVVAAFNADFDMGFLNAEARRLGRKFDNKSWCVTEQSRSAFGWVPGGHSLKNISEVLSISFNGKSHRAAADAEMALRVCVAIWKGQKPFGAEKVKVTYVSELKSWDNGKALDTIDLRLSTEHPVALREWKSGEFGRMWTRDSTEYINIYSPVGEYGRGVVARIYKESNPEFLALLKSPARISVKMQSAAEGLYELQFTME